MEGIGIGRTIGILSPATRDYQETSCFHITQLEPFKESRNPGQIAKPGPLPNKEDEDTYDVEKIVDSQSIKKGYMLQEVIPFR
jgi:hypothetical protein